MEKSLDVESIEDQKETIDYNDRIMNATDNMIARDPDFWDKLDRYKNGNNWRVNWIK